MLNTMFLLDCLKDSFQKFTFKHDSPLYEREPWKDMNNDKECWRAVAAAASSARPVPHEMSHAACNFSKLLQSVGVWSLTQASR